MRTDFADAEAVIHGDFPFESESAKHLSAGRAAWKEYKATKRQQISVVETVSGPYEETIDSYELRFGILELEPANHSHEVPLDKEKHRRSLYESLSSPHTSDTKLNARRISRANYSLEVESSSAKETIELHESDQDFDQASHDLFYLT